MAPTQQGSIRLFQFRGVQVFLHWSWFVVALIEFNYRSHIYRSFVWNALEYLALFGIVLMHEFGHSLACRQVGGTADQIILWPLGGVAYVSPPQRPGATLWSIAAGPLVNVLLAPFLIVLFLVARQQGLIFSSPNAYILIRNICIINLGLLIFNLLPIYPLDGGQILRSLLWFVVGRARSLMIASVIGLAGVVALIGLAVWQGSFWIGIIAVFILLNCWRGLMHARLLARVARLPRRPGFACPSCQQAPPLGPLWRCGKCMHPFDTFVTHSVCPHCGTAFPLTQCLDCGESYPITQWSTPRCRLSHRFLTMSQKLVFSVLCVACLLLASCGTRPAKRIAHFTGESLVFVDDEPAALAHVPAGHLLSVRSTYLPGPESTHYLEGRDFAVDYAAGTLRRIPGSRIPDFRTNMLFGQENFDHTKFPGFGNNGYFVFVDYNFVPSGPWPNQPRQTQYLRNTQAKLRSGAALKIVAFGDSITAGGEATKPELIFWRRWADYLQQKYPRARITAVNGATGGDTTVQGLQRLKSKVLDEAPDLVLIGFGMNDHNVNSVPVPNFEQNLKQMIARIRSQTGAEIILFSAFPPNPKWKFGSHHMADYAAATQRVAHETDTAYADVFNNWQALASRKKPEDLLGNNINHPNDFGHWIYYRVFEELGL